MAKIMRFEELKNGGFSFFLAAVGLQAARHKGVSVPQGTVPLLSSGKILKINFYRWRLFSSGPELASCLIC